jgi:hypothetical protein
MTRIGWRKPPPVFLGAILPLAKETRVKRAGVFTLQDRVWPFLFLPLFTNYVERLSNKSR